MMVESLWAISKVICSFLAEISRMVAVISSSVIESSADVASSNNKSLGLRNKARAMDILCFSPPDNFSPPSPITELMPLSVRLSRDSQEALSRADCISSSVASGLTNSRFSLMVPEKSCVSCVTNPICFLRSSKSISFSSKPL